MEKEQGLLRFTAAIYGTGFTRIWLCVSLLAAMTSGAQFALTWYLGVVMDSVGQGLQAVLHYFTVISISVAVYVAGNAALGYVSGRITSRFMLKIRCKLGDKLCHAEYAALERVKDGDLLSIMTNDIESFRPWLAALYSLGHLPVKFLLVLVAVFFINWKLALFMLPVIPLAMLPSLLLSSKLHSLYVHEKEAIGKTTSFIGEVLDFILVVKSFCLEAVFLSKNRKLLTDLEMAQRRRQLQEQIIQTYGRCLGHISNSLTFIFGAFLILQGELTIGQIVTLMLLMNLGGEAVNLIYAIPTGYQGAKAVMTRMRKILSLPDEATAETEAPPPNETSPVFSVKDLRFFYEEVPVLKNIDFSIGRGEKIAIIGMSGSGKTTLLKLLCGLYRPAAGYIQLQGADMSALSAEAIRRELSVVPQESFLFTGTIRDNLLLARPGVDDGELVAACQRAQIHDFILSLPNDYDTPLADVGTAMSKGQMQRVNLARAFLRDSPICLLDEPTSALDPDMHRVVMNIILHETAGKTIVMITHDPAVAARFDRVFVMQNGTLREENAR